MIQRKGKGGEVTQFSQFRECRDVLDFPSRTRSVMEYDTEKGKAW
jgi:hypothetical protein